VERRRAEVGLALKRDLFITGQRGHVGSVQAEFELPAQLIAPLSTATAVGKVKVVVKRRHRSDIRPLPGAGRASGGFFRRVVDSVACGSSDMATPCPTCYLNGAYLPLAEARISPLDRGFLFADGVYE